MFPALRGRRLLVAALAATLSIFFLWSLLGDDASQFARPFTPPTYKYTPDEAYAWRAVVINYPVASMMSLPTSPIKRFPKVQADFRPETEAQRTTRRDRQSAVKKTFLRSWGAYKQHAWLQDELKPVTGGGRDPFGGWAATLVDALDTLWIMDLKDEFTEAVDAVEKIDFAKTTLSEVNVFETTIRYLGGFLSAYDLSGDARLLKRAVEVGDLVYKAFDTPNHMPIMRWDFRAALRGEKQVAGSGTLIAEIGSLSMELTRLSQITGDPRWFDAAHRITVALAEQQDSTELPGLWPLVVNAEEMIFNSGSAFTLGAMADSLYEYLPKMAALTGGQLPVYQTMYEKAMDIAPKHNFFRPMTPTNEDILVSTQVHPKKNDENTQIQRDNQGQHLVCFLGGMFALGSKLFDRPQDAEYAEKLTNGCIYAYQAFPHKVMPETWQMLACDPGEECRWDEERWKAEVLKANEPGTGSTTRDAVTIIRDDSLPEGFTKIPDRRYILRPEALESVFILYRTTGRQDFADTAWDMFSAIEAATATDLGNSAVSDITRGGVPPMMDSMESFWMGETLKYAYLTFSDPVMVSLDEFVFNTEAHPLRRLK